MKTIVIIKASITLGLCEDDNRIQWSLSTAPGTEQVGGEGVIWGPSPSLSHSHSFTWKPQEACCIFRTGVCQTPCPRLRLRRNLLWQEGIILHIKVKNESSHPSHPDLGVMGFFRQASLLCLSATGLIIAFWTRIDKLPVHCHYWMFTWSIWWILIHKKNISIPKAILGKMMPFSPPVSYRQPPETMYEVK